jgi:hypothetical protein
MKEMHDRHRIERRDLHGNHRAARDQQYLRHAGEHKAMAEKHIAEMLAR